MTHVAIDNNARLALENAGIYLLHNGNYFINPNTLFEPPVLTSGFARFDALEIGAFSYSMSGFGTIVGWRSCLERRQQTTRGYKSLRGSSRL